MAHKNNRNQGVFIPYNQLVDLRSLNHPQVTFVQGPPIGLVNPRNGPVGAQQFVPIGVSTFNRSFHEFFIRMEEERSRSLLQFMAGEGLVPSPEEEIKRKNAIEKLKQIVMEWIKRVACSRGLDERRVAAASAAVLTYGSYGLGVTTIPIHKGITALLDSQHQLLNIHTEAFEVLTKQNILDLEASRIQIRMTMKVHNSESDIDALCVGPRFATMGEDFFVVLYNMLTSRPEVSEVLCIKDAKVPLMRFKLDGISIDLPYAQLKVMSVPQNVDILNLYFLRNIDETSWRSLSGVHANQCILQLVPNKKVFQSLLRCIKLWAKRRGVYGNLLGFFGGVHLAILVAFICQRHPNARLSGLIFSFFGTFAFWDWPNPIILQDGMPISGNVAEPRSLMPIRLPCKPHEYCHSNITKSTFYRIRVEFLRGHTLIKDHLRPDFDWGCLFEPFPYAKKYKRFVKICLSASDQVELGEWVGWVKSRFRSLLVKLEEIQGFCDPNPTECVDVNVAEPNTVFYWGLQPDRSDFLDIKSVKEEFVKSLSNGPTGNITLSVVQASQLPKNAQFDSESNKGYLNPNANLSYPIAAG